VSYFSFARPPKIPDDCVEIAPDLIVEILERNESPASASERVRDFIAFGVPLVWLVETTAKTVTVSSGNMRGVEHHDTDTLDGGTVRPGFICPVADLFA